MKLNFISIIFLIAFLFSFKGFCQMRAPSISDIEIGRKSNGHPISATKLSFDEFISQIYFGEMNEDIHFKTQKLSKNQKYFKSMGYMSTLSLPDYVLMGQKAINYYCQTGNSFV